MSGKIKLIVFVAIFAAVVAGAVYLYDYLGRQAEEPPASAQTTAASGVDTTTRPENAVLATDFSVEDSSGNDVKLSDMLGKPVVLNFWASWCPPCKKELPDFEKLYTETGGDVVFMMINLTDGSRETKQIAADFISELEYTFPVYYDVDIDAARKYVGQYIPMTYFIDKEGYAVAAKQGQIDEATLRKGIDMIK